jgi:hypothetical protein
LRRGGRQRRIDQRAVEIQTALRAEQLAAPTMIADAMGATVTALVAVIAELQTQIGRLETELADRFEQRVRGRPEPLRHHHVSPELQRHVTHHPGDVWEGRQRDTLLTRTAHCL